MNFKKNAFPKIQNLTTEEIQGNNFYFISDFLGIIHLQCLLSTGIDRTVESNVVKPTSVIINETAIWWMLFNIRGRICAVAGQHLPTVAQLATS
ncbi:hypothetical protein D917_05629 [Trichinella nativa]|uniref:Uncharacterized protein n=1 Tax=Trichinella nativa TaxID=6335 RepID=A0A1Y3EVI4_9BILA|nr:hypothetical protein D917_05629 [Trichinella nativa]